MLQTDIIRKVDRSSQIARAERLLSPQMIQKTKAVRFPLSNLHLFEVQDKSTGYAIYKCYEQKLVSDNWDDATGLDKFADKSTVEIEVMNLDEQDPYDTANYWPALCKFDRIAAWQIKDDKGNLRWVGKPIGPFIRLVQSTQNAPSPDKVIGLKTSDCTVTCDVLLNNHNWAIEGQLGYHIEIIGRASPSGTYWEEAVPMILENGVYFAYCKHGEWYFDDVFMRSCVGDNVYCKP